MRTERILRASVREVALLRSGRSSGRKVEKLLVLTYVARWAAGLQDPPDPLWVKQILADAQKAGLNDEVLYRQAVKVRPQNWASAPPYGDVKPGPEVRSTSIMEGGSSSAETADKKVAESSTTSSAPGKPKGKAVFHDVTPLHLGQSVEIAAADDAAYWASLEGQQEAERQRQAELERLWEEGGRPPLWDPGPLWGGEPVRPRTSTAKS